MRSVETLLRGASLALLFLGAGIAFGAEPLPTCADIGVPERAGCIVAAGVITEMGTVNLIVRDDESRALVLRSSSPLSEKAQSIPIPFVESHDSHLISLKRGDTIEMIAIEDVFEPAVGYATVRWLIVNIKSKKIIGEVEASEPPTLRSTKFGWRISLLRDVASPHSLEPQLVRECYCIDKRSLRKIANDSCE